MRVGEDPAAVAENSREENCSGDLQHKPGEAQPLDLRYTLDASKQESDQDVVYHVPNEGSLDNTEGEDSNQPVEMTEEELEELEMAEAAVKAHGDHSAAATQSLLLPPLPVKQTWLQSVCGFKRKAKPRILGKVLDARVNAMHIKSEVQLLEDEEEKEMLLLKHFILSQLTGYKRAIAERYLLDEGRFYSQKYHSIVYRRTVRHVSMFLLPILWLALIYMVYLFHLPLASRSSVIWVVINVLHAEP